MVDIGEVVAKNCRTDKGGLAETSHCTCFDVGYGSCLLTDGRHTCVCWCSARKVGDSNQCLEIVAEELIKRKEGRPMKVVKGEEVEDA